MKEEIINQIQQDISMTEEQLNLKAYQKYCEDFE